MKLIMFFYHFILLGSQHVLGCVSFFINHLDCEKKPNRFFRFIRNIKLILAINALLICQRLPRFFKVFPMFYISQFLSLYMYSQFDCLSAAYANLNKHHSMHMTKWPFIITHVLYSECFCIWTSVTSVSLGANCIHTCSWCNRVLHLYHTARSQTYIKL